VVVVNSCVFGPKRDEVAEDWRRLHNEELYNLYSLMSTIKVIKSEKMIMSGACSTRGLRKKCI